jgi:hypothetical protein
MSIPIHGLANRLFTDGFLKPDLCPEWGQRSWLLTGLITSRRKDNPSANRNDE